ncbi:MAG TPA: hypothetical protein DEB09_05035 [Candidatus Magasanikbacteria bacterium]|nr:hypothetical protein [Candidatus Magasanikbacteria bacterium]
MLTTNTILFTVYCLLFTYLAWKNFPWGLYLFFFLLPTYLIRFNIGPLPTTLLEVMLWIITIIWLIKYHSHIIYHITHTTKQNKILFIGIAVFLLSATVSIFTSTDVRSALGEWKAFYIEPIILFLILITTFNPKNYPPEQTQLDQKIKRSKDQFSVRSSDLPIFRSSIINHIIFALILSGLITSVLAIYQHFTGWMVPYAFWQNQNTFRVTAWYGFPNAVGLFLTPLFPLAIYGLKESIKNKSFNLFPTEYGIPYYIGTIFQSLIKIILYSLFLILSPLAILYSKGTGPLIGLVAGIGILLLFYKKTRWPTVILSLICLSSLFSFSSLSSLKNEVLLQDRSGQIRLSIWNETWQFLKDNPITGAGLASYQEKIKPYHTTVNGEGIEIFHHPHNIFLTMWINLGLLGLASFIGILVSLFLIPCLTGRQAYSLFKKNENIPIIQYFLTASLTTIIVTGLVDSPYIKNDLSILFWLLPALLIMNSSKSQSVKSLNKST